MKTYEIPELICPECSCKMDRAVPVPGQAEEAAPRDGDFTVCSKCGSMLELEGSDLLKITAEHLMLLAITEPETLRMLTRTSEYFKKRSNEKS